MEALTGQRNISASALLNYFEPLRVWLEKENAQNSELIGWNDENSIKNLLNTALFAILITPNVFIFLYFVVCSLQSLIF